MQCSMQLSSFIDCLDKQRWEELDKYIKTGFHIDTELQHNVSALCLAVLTENIKTVEFILRFKPNIKSSSNRNCIICALDANETSSRIITRRLLRYGFKLSSEHFKDYDLLHKAFEKRNEEFVEYFLKNAEVAAISTHCNFLLLSAIDKKMWKIAQLLIELEFNVNLVDENGRTPLINCLFKPRTIVKHGSKVPVLQNTDTFTSDHQDVIKILLEHPHIDFAIIDSDGRSALNYILFDESVYADADEETKIEMIKLFLRNGVNINAQNNVGIPFIHDAARSNSSNIVEFLLTCKADVNAIDKYGQTAFHVSMRNLGQFEITDIFLRYEINLNSRNENGESLLYTACSIRHEKVVKILLEKNVDVNEIQNDGETALHAASYSISYRDFLSGRIFPLLMKHKPVVNHQNKYGYTALHYAALGSGREAVKILLDNGAKVNIENDEGETALHYAVLRANVSNVNLLLNHGAKVNFPDGKGNVPLVTAVNSKNIDVVKGLIDAGADVNAKDPSGKTALQIACELRLPLIVDFLLLCGADFNVLDKDGETPLSFLMNKNEDESEKILLEVVRTGMKLFSHITAMKAAGLYVNQKNLETLEENDDWNTIELEGIEEFPVDYEQQSTYLKTKIPGTNISFLDFVVQNTCKIEIYMKNQNIAEEICSGLEHCRIYGGVILANIRKAGVRNCLSEQSFKILHNLFQNFPPFCIEKILTFLDISDLKILTEGGDIPSIEDMLNVDLS